MEKPRLSTVLIASGLALGGVSLVPFRHAETLATEQGKLQEHYETANATRINDARATLAAAELVYEQAQDQFDNVRSRSQDPDELQNKQLALEGIGWLLVASASVVVGVGGLARQEGD